MVRIHHSQQYGPDADGRSTPLQGDRLGSIPTVSTKYTRVWCNGSMPVSKTVDGSSNLSTRAPTLSCSVMAAHHILAVVIQVRVLAGQPRFFEILSISSAVEHFSDKEAVAGSSPASTTRFA